MRAKLFVGFLIILAGAGCLDDSVASPTPVPVEATSPVPTIVPESDIAPVIETEPEPTPVVSEPILESTPEPVVVPEPVVTPEPEPVYVAPTPAPTPAPAPTTSCCKICTTGQACGDSCISKSYTCHKGPGCACNGY